jgi:hypothetical protein
MKLTSYDGPRVDCRTGTVLHECPRSLEVEKFFQAPHDGCWKRSGKWGLYEKGHCVLNARQASQDVCIDGTFSSQPFLHYIPFHGGIGFGSCLNSGANSGVNNVELRWTWDPDFYGPGVGEWVCTLWTNRLVKKDEEFLWNYPPSGGYYYREYNSRAYPFDLFGSSPNDATTPNVPAAKILRKAANATPATKSKPRAAKASEAIAFSAPDASLSYGPGTAAFNEEEDSNSDSAESGSSVSSSDDEQVPGIRGIQPVFPEINVPIYITARKLQINWQVVNEITSNIAVGARLQ